MQGTPAANLSGTTLHDVEEEVDEAQWIENAREDSGGGP